MKVQISDNLIKHYLRNVYFINGHSYAGKSTMVRMLAQRYDMIACGENYHDVFPREKLSRWKQPGRCYFDTMSGWEEWLNMTPEEHWNWTEQTSRECAEIEILELVKLSARGKKIIVDTNIPVDILRGISDYRHVAIMLCNPPDICAARFFDRDDPDKKFMMEQIKRCRDPEATLKNFIPGCSTIRWRRLTGSIPVSLPIRAPIFESDTREEVLNVLARHFGLVAECE